MSKRIVLGGAAVGSFLALAACGGSGTTESSAGDAATDSPSSRSADAAATDGAQGPDSGGFGFPVSNVPGVPIGDGGALGDIDITRSCTLDSVKGSFSNCGAVGGGARFEKMTTSAGSLGVLYVHALTVEHGATLGISGGLPLVIVAVDQVNVFGEISVAAAAAVGVAGGAFVDGTTGKGGGPGAGALAPGEGPGGGSFCGAGGAGGSGAVDAGTGGGGNGGPTYGTPSLVPLLGGSSGAGNSNANSSVGGAGGGAIQISAKNVVTVSGAITAGGGGGGGSANTSGGSGGAILLEAGLVTVSGVLAANGGGGGPGGGDATINAEPAQGGTGKNSVGTSIGGSGAAAGTIAGGAGQLTAGGGGGAGWIRINTTAGSATTTGSTLSPSLGSGCASQGTLGG